MQGQCACRSFPAEAGSEVLARSALAAPVGGLGGHRLDVPLAKQDQLLAVELDLESGRRQIKNLVAEFSHTHVRTDEANICPDKPFGRLRRRGGYQQAAG